MSKSIDVTKKPKAGLTEEEKDEMFMDFGRDKVKRESKDSVQKWFSLMSNSKLKLHEKVYSMVIDDIKNLLYTCGSEKIIMSTNLK